MRTKTLLLTAALTAAGALSSMAQVYSVNIVGYINLNIPKGFSLVANQLDNATDNTISTLFPTAPEATFIFKFFPGSGFGQALFSGGVWDAGGAFTMNPGEGVFIAAPSAFSATFVGQVRTGHTDLPITNGFSIVSSEIPQAGNLYDPAHGPDLGFGPLGAGDSGLFVFPFVNPTGYSQYLWDGGSWGATPTGPSVAVGEAVFIANPAARHWVRDFAVGP